jgi:limonene 1,2-monooxygenase
VEFGIFSNGFRPHSTAAESYAEDIREIVLADELGFRDAYISEHHGEPPHIGKVDTIPVPDLIICKAAGLTRNIRMGSAVKLIHLQHPVDVAIQAAVTDHLLGPGRYIFGFGTGFSAPRFSEERGLSFDDRQARLLESLEIIQRCWQTEQPFDVDGRFWKGKGILALPKPLAAEGPPMATATHSDAMLKIAGERDYTLLFAFLDQPQLIHARVEKYNDFAAASGRPRSRKNVTVSRLVYIAESREQAIEDLRDAVAYEVGVQAQRGFLAMLKRNYNIDVPNDRSAIDVLAGSGLYVLGTAEEVTRQLEDFYRQCGGFGTLLIVAGKSWATPEKRARSMRAFMQNVAPKLRLLDEAQPQLAAAD